MYWVWMQKIITGTKKKFATQNTWIFGDYLKCLYTQPVLHHEIKLYVTILHWKTKMVFDYREAVSGHCVKIMEIGYLVMKIKSRSQHWNRLHIPKSYLEKWNNLSAKYCTIGHEDIPKISILIWVTLYLNVYKYISNLKINFLIKKIKCNQYHNPEGFRTITIHPVFIRHTHTLLEALSKCITI